MRLLVAAGCLLFAAAPAAAEPHTPAELLRPAEIREIALSPDGKRVALARRPQRGSADQISVIDLERIGAPDSIRNLPLDPGERGARVVELHWANSRRLVAAVAPDSRQHYVRYFTSFGTVLEFRNRGRLHSFDGTGTDPVVILDERFDSRSIIDDAPAESDMATLQAHESGTLNLYRVDLQHGTARLLARGDSLTCCWRVVGGMPVLKTNRVPGGSRVHLYVPATEDLSRWTYQGSVDGETEHWVKTGWVGDADSATAVYLRNRGAGSDIEGVHLYDLAANEITATLSEVEGHDIDSALVVRNQFVAASYVDDRQRQVIANAGLQEHYDVLLARFGAESSVEIVDLDRSRSHLLLRVSGPRQPGQYFWYESGSNRVEEIAGDRPWLDAGRLTGMFVRRIRSRDGLQIDSYLTCPDRQTGQPAPLVVVPPAGPWTRSYLRFSAAAQAFASQGWCVLETNYRGVSSYGRARQEAGFGQWSGGVADDLVDAIRDVVDAGLVDAARIAFYSEGLAAYAALSAAIDHPGLFRAGVTMNAVTDLDAQLNALRMTFSNRAPIVKQWRAYRGEESRLSSPLVRASRLAVPLLVIRGPGLFEVPVSQSDAMLKALRKAGIPVSDMLLPDDDSWAALENHESLAVQRAVTFLQSIF